MTDTNTTSRDDELLAPAWHHLTSHEQTILQKRRLEQILYADGISKTRAFKITQQFFATMKVLQHGND